MKDPRSIEKADVYRGDERVGSLARTQAGCAFTYEEGFYSRHQHLPGGIALHLPYGKRRHEHRGDNLHPYFAGLLPEGLRLKSIIHRFKTSESDLFTLLLAGGPDTVGDVSVVEEGTQPHLTEPVTRLQSLDSVSFAELWEHSLAAADAFEPSIPGVQEKLSPSMISFPLRAVSQRKAYILKLNPKERPRLVENEAFFMSCAAACGLEVAKCWLVHDKTGAAGLLVERFDRRWNAEAKRMERVHQEDACQLMNRYPQDKYRLSCADVSAALSACAAALPARGRFLELLVFSYLICNGDLHAKNVSVVDSAVGWVVAPAYDLLSSLPYGNRKMALKLEGRDDNFKRRDFVAFGQRVGLSAVFVGKRIDHLRQQLSPWLARLSEIGLSARRTVDLQRTMTKRLADLE